MDDSKERELEEFSQLYFKYTKLFEDQAAAMRHDPERLNAAYAKVYPEAVEERENGLLKSEEIHPYLDRLVKRCEVPPRSFEDRIRIIFSAEAYVHIMMSSVLGAASRPESDGLTVLARGCQLLREDFLRQTSATMPIFRTHLPP